MPRFLQYCLDANLSPSFFDIAFALAVHKFDRERCEAVVLEVGLGGELDSTNVIRSPALSIITSIQKDHTKILGSTLEEIAKVKSGIMKPNRPVLLGPHCPLDVLRSEATRRRAGPVFTLADFEGRERENRGQGEEKGVWTRHYLGSTAAGGSPLTGKLN